MYRGRARVQGRGVSAPRAAAPSATAAPLGEQILDADFLMPTIVARVMNLSAWWMMDGANKNMCQLHTVINSI